MTFCVYLRTIRLKYRKSLLFEFLLIFFIAIPAVSFSFTKTQKNENIKIGVIIYSDNFEDAYRGFRNGLRDLGYSGVTLVKENINSDLTKVPDLLAKFHKQKINIILATTTPLNKKIMEYNDKYEFSVIFNEVADPVRAGLAKSLNLPGQNFTGITHAAFRIIPKRLEMFTDVFPKRKKIISFINTKSFFAKYENKQINIFNKYYPEVDVIQLDVNSSGKIRQALNNLNLKNPENYGIVMMLHPLFVKEFKKIKAYALKNRIPIMVVDNSLLKRGGTFGYAPNFYSIGYQSSYIASRIIRGFSASDIPVQLPNKITLAINLKIIKKMGISFNENYLAYANSIINE